jgi:hypothetical protein
MTTPAHAPNLLQRRPAETTGSLAGAVAVLLYVLLGIDDETVLGALVVVVGALPAIVTQAVEQVRRARE